MGAVIKMFILSFVFYAVAISILYGIYKLAQSEKYQTKCPRIIKVLIGIILSVFLFLFLLPLLRMITTFSGITPWGETTTLMSCITDVIGILASIPTALFFFFALAGSGKATNIISVILFLVMFALTIFSVVLAVETQQYFYLVLYVLSCATGLLAIYKLLEAETKKQQAIDDLARARV